MRTLTILLLVISLSGKAQNQSANDRMLISGEQTKRLEKRQGAWDVVMEFKPSPDAPVITVKGITAKRTMMGQYLQEIMEPDGSSPKFTRISYTVYNQADNRWENVSIDTRISSIMNRENFGDEQPDHTTYYIMNFTVAGFGKEFEGKSYRLRDEVIFKDEDHDEIQQYWQPAGAKEWMAVHYVYTRRK